MKNSNIINAEDRLEMLLDALGLTMYTLSKELGYKNNNSIQRIKLEPKKIEQENLVRKIIQRFPFVNINFLKNGELPVALKPEEQLIQQTLLSIKDTPKYDELMIANLDNKMNLIIRELLNIKEEIKSLKEQKNQ